jgi:enoyl-CoA hydratase
MPSWTVVTLNHPAERNRLSRTTLEELRQRLDNLAAGPARSVVILTGTTGFFSVGADLREIAALTPAEAADFSRLGQEVIGRLETVAPVTIAAIDGYCLGGGLDLALGCTFRYASPGSSFQHPGAARGIITGWGGTQRLPRLIGIDAARRLLLLGERIEAVTAQRIGLITGISDDPLGHAIRMAEEITARFGPAELAAFKRDFGGSD